MTQHKVGRTLLKKATAIIFVFFIIVTAQPFIMRDGIALASSAPAEVKKIKAVPESSSSIEVSWKKVKRAKKYEIYQATKRKGKYKKIKTTKKRIYVVKRLKANKKYYFKVRAVNGKRKGKFSYIVYAKTPNKSSVVPSLTNMDLDKAKSLIKAGFKVGKIDYGYDERAPKGIVLYQQYQSNSLLEKGTPIDLYVSSGPEPK